MPESFSDNMQEKEKKPATDASLEMPPDTELPPNPEKETHRETASEHREISKEEALLLLLEQVQLPFGPDTTYSPELYEEIVQDAQSLWATYNAFVRARQGSDKKREKKHQEVLLEKIQTYIQRITRQFLRDNLPQSDFKKFEKGRLTSLRKTVSLETAKTYLSALRALAEDNEQRAKEILQTYVRTSVLYLEPEGTLHPQTTRVIESLTSVQFLFAKERLFPLMQEKIREFAAKGEIRGFTDRAKNTGVFWDWVRTPFNTETRDHIASTVTPMIQMWNSGELGHLAPMLRDLAMTAFHVSLADGQLLELLLTIKGVVEFDILLSIVTFGAGSWLKSAQLSGTTTSILNGLLKSSEISTEVAADVGRVHQVVQSLHGSFEKIQQRTADAAQQAEVNLQSLWKENFGRTSAGDPSKESPTSAEKE